MNTVITCLCLLGTFIFICLIRTVNAEPIFHEKYYPSGEGPFPVVIALHTSNGYKTVRKAIKGFTNAGYAVYTPNYFKKPRRTAKGTLIYHSSSICFPVKIRDIFRKFVLLNMSANLIFCSVNLIK